MMMLCPAVALCAVSPLPTAYDVALIGGGAAALAVKSGCRAHEVDLARLGQRLCASGAIVPGPNGFGKGKGADAR